MSDTDYDEMMEELIERHTAYVYHAPDRGVSYSLYHTHENGWETPMLMFNSGLTLRNSVHPEIGAEAGITLDERFFNALAYSYHSVMSMMAMTSASMMREEIDDTIDHLYENDAGVVQCSDWERWMIHSIVQDAVGGGKSGPELGPIFEYMDACTGFGGPEYLEMP